MTNSKILILLLTFNTIIFSAQNNFDNNKAEKEFKDQEIDINAISDREKAKIINHIFYDIIARQEMNNSQKHAGFDTSPHSKEKIERFTTCSNESYNSMLDSTKNIIGIIKNQSAYNYANFCCDCYNKIKSANIRNHLVNPSQSQIFMQFLS